MGNDHADSCVEAIKVRRIKRLGFADLLLAGRQEALHVHVETLHG